MFDSPWVVHVMPVLQTKQQEGKQRTARCRPRWSKARSLRQALRSPLWISESRNMPATLPGPADRHPETRSPRPDMRRTGIHRSSRSSGSQTMPRSPADPAPVSPAGASIPLADGSSGRRSPREQSSRHPDNRPYRSFYRRRLQPCSRGFWRFLRNANKTF